MRVENDSRKNGGWPVTAEQRMELAVIVGGSAGLGLILAERLATEGAARIVLVARNEQRLAAAQMQVAKKFPQTQFNSCVVDVAAPEGAATLAASLASIAEPVDLLINAVGLSDRGTLLGLNAVRVDELVRANVIGPLHAVQALVPRMRAGSAIINIGSLSSYLAPRYLGGYSIAKHGLRAMTQQLRMELASQSIHVMLVCPGPIAREDTGSRYSHLASAADLPGEAMQGGGGAKIKGLDAHQLAIDILQAVRARKLEIVRPRKVRLLLILSAIWPRAGEWILKRKTGSG